MEDVALDGSRSRIGETISATDMTIEYDGDQVDVEDVADKDLCRRNLWPCAHLPLSPSLGHVSFPT